MAGLAEYKRLVRKWRRKYRDQIPKPEVDLLSVTVARECLWCGRNEGKLHRHHVGNDLEFARLFPDEFAPRYVQYLEEDIIILCDKCHEDMHWWYAPIILQFRQRMAALDKRAADQETYILLCKEFQKRCREECFRVIEEEPRR